MTLEELCAKGDEHADEGVYVLALSLYEAALDLVPRPATDHAAATWIYAAIGDVHFLQDRFAEADEAFRLALMSPGGVGNPWIHLRRGQVIYRLGDLTRAANELTLAYMGQGKELFLDDDPEYWDFLTTRIKVPDADRR